MGEALSISNKSTTPSLNLIDNKEIFNFTSILREKIIGWTLKDTVVMDNFLKKKNYYLTGEVLGSGGFGIIAKGVNGKSKKEVAIKILKFKSREQFFQNMEEFNKHQQLLHPNVLFAIEMINFNELKIQLIVMDLCQTDLMNLFKSFAQKGQWPEKDQIIEIMLQLAEGLDFLHKKKVLHLDIKPDNILLGSDGKWKYSDFGLSQELLNGENSTFSMKGLTSIWCSPEQYFHSLNIQQSIQKESDIYSLGMVFLNMTQVILDQKESVQIKFEERKLTNFLNPNFTEFNFKLITKMIKIIPSTRISIEKVKETLEQMKDTLHNKEKLELQIPLSSNQNLKSGNDQDTSNTNNQNSSKLKKKITPVFMAKIDKNYFFPDAPQVSHPTQRRKNENDEVVNQTKKCQLANANEMNLTNKLQRKQFLNIAQEGVKEQEVIPPSKGSKIKQNQQSLTLLTNFQNNNNNSNNNVTLTVEDIGSFQTLTDTLSCRNRMLPSISSTNLKISKQLLEVLENQVTSSSSSFDELKFPLSIKERRKVSKIQVEGISSNFNNSNDKNKNNNNNNGNDSNEKNNNFFYPTSPNRKSIFEQRKKFHYQKNVQINLHSLEDEPKPMQQYSFLPCIKT